MTTSTKIFGWYSYDIGSPVHAEDLTIHVNAIMNNVPNNVRPLFIPCFSSKLQKEVVVVAKSEMSEEVLLEYIENHASANYVCDVDLIATSTSDFAAVV